MSHQHPARGTTILLLIALACFLAAAGLYRHRDAGPCLKIKPWDFAREQEALRTLSLREVDQAREKAETDGITIEEALGRTLAENRTAEEKRLASAPLEEFIARMTRDKLAEVSGPAWAEFFHRVQTAFRTKELSRDWVRRVTGDDLTFGRFESLFFRTTEPPFDQWPVRPAAGQTLYLKLQSIPPQYFEVYALGADEAEGRESGRHDAPILWRRPPAFAYPYRGWAGWLLLAGCGLVVLPLMGRYAAFLGRARHPEHAAFRNMEKRLAADWTGVALVALAFMLLPFITGMDLMGGGFALMTMALFVVITGVVAAVIYGRRGARLQKLVSGENLLAHWTYTPAEWRSYVEADFAEEKEEKAALFKLVAVIALVVGLGFLVVHRNEAGVITFIFILAVIALLGIVAFEVPRANRRKQERSGAEAYQSLAGAYVGGNYHDWGMMGARIEGAAIEDEPAPMAVVSYWAPTQAGGQTYTVRVPIPAGKRDDAERWIQRLLEAVARNPAED